MERKSRGRKGSTAQSPLSSARESCGLKTFKSMSQLSSTCQGSRKKKLFLFGGGGGKGRAIKGKELLKNINKDYFSL